MSITSALHQNALFAGVRPEAVDALTGPLQRLHLTPGQVLFSEGERGDALYLVLDGLIQIYSGTDDMTITTFLPGAYFGEMALLGESIRSASARAIDETVLLPIDRETFARITREHPVVVNNVSRALSERLMATTRALVEVERGELVLVAVSGLAELKPVVTYLWEAAAAISGKPVAVLAPRALLGHATSVTAAVRSNERPAQADEGLSFFGYRAGALLDARVLSGTIGTMADYFRRWWSRTLVFIGDDELAWFQAALPWADRAFVIGRPEELARWPLETADGSERFTGRSHIEAVPLIASSRQQAAAAAQAERAGFRVPRVYLPEARALEGQVRQGFQREQLGDVYAPVQRGILRLARAVAGSRVGIAFGAGGARGFAHIGVLRYLEERGIVPDAITGTSMGALVGAGVASGLDSHQAEAKMQEFLRSHVRSLLRPALPIRSFFAGRGADNVCRWLYGNTTFRDLLTPMSIIATDLVSGRGIALREGSVAQAVRASISIPGMFPPFVTGPYVFVDGGVCEPVPTAALASLGADISIAVNISVTAEDMARWAAEEGGSQVKRPIRRGIVPNILDTYTSSISIAVSDRAMGSTQAADISIRPRFRVAGWREFQQGPEHFKRGYTAAADADAQLAERISWFRRP